MRLHQLANSFNPGNLQTSSFIVVFEILCSVSPCFSIKSVKALRLYSCAFASFYIDLAVPSCRIFHFAFGTNCVPLLNLGFGGTQQLYGLSNYVGLDSVFVVIDTLFFALQVDAGEHDEGNGLKQEARWPLVEWIPLCSEGRLRRFQLFLV